MPSSRRIHNHALPEGLHTCRLMNVTTDDQLGLKLEHVLLQGRTADVLTKFRPVQAIQWWSVRNNNVVIPEVKRTRVRERIDRGERPLLCEVWFVESAGLGHATHADTLVLKLERPKPGRCCCRVKKGDALISNVLRERLEKIVRHVNVMIALHPEDFRVVRMESFKPIAGHLEFAFGLKSVAEWWAHSVIGQVASDQNHVCLGKFLEVEFFVLAVNVADRQDTHPTLVVPGWVCNPHLPIALSPNLLDSAQVNCFGQARGDGVTRPS
jgi:hypothetical protein